MLIRQFLVQFGHPLILYVLRLEEERISLRQEKETLGVC